MSHDVSFSLSNQMQWRAGDEQRPSCKECSLRGVPCEWGVRLVFRPEHVESIPASHPSMLETAKSQCCGDVEVRLRQNRPQCSVVLIILDH